VHQRTQLKYIHATRAFECVVHDVEGIVKSQVMMSPPLDRIKTAAALGAQAIHAAGLVAERPEVAIAVEQHRWAWKPQNVRVLLVAESHVYTSAEDSALHVRTELLPERARHAPREFVRLVYCLGYGETWLLDSRPRQSNAGTWQFWNIFGRLTGNGRQPTRPNASGAHDSPGRLIR